VTGRTEGLAFFTRERIVDSSVVRLNEGRVGLAVRLARMPEVPVVVTHLAANRRIKQIASASLEYCSHGQAVRAGHPRR
jgi:hypothetical protein